MKSHKNKRCIKNIFPARCQLACPVITATLMILSALTMPSISMAKGSALKQFSATVKIHFGPTGQLFNAARVYVNQSGFRVEGEAGHSDHIIISNINDRAIWLLDKTRKVFHKQVLSYVDSDLNMPEGLIMLPGNISSIPCFAPDLTGQQAGDILYDGELLEVWNCTAVKNRQVDETFPVQQYYSRENHLVLYSRDSQGFETTVSNIKVAGVPDELMLAPPHYRAISLDEFMGFDHLLETYRSSK